MSGLGVFLVILGVGSFLLPLIGYEFTLMSWVYPYQPWAGIGVALGGVALWLLARQRAAASSMPPAPGSPQEGGLARESSDPTPPSASVR